MDYNKPLDDIIMEDRKKNRQNRGRNNGQRGANLPLPGRGRGGLTNVQRAQAVQKVRQNMNGISKQRQQNQQQRGQKQNLQRRNQQNNNQRQQNLMGNQNQRQNGQNAQGPNNTNRRRQLLNNLRQNRRNRGRRTNQPMTQNANNAGNQPPLKKRMPQAPVVARQANQPQQLQRTLSVVQGTLQERKLKVRNIDARTVSVQDLQKLFGKCGPLISALFDTNEFGQYLGTATVIYSRASSAQRAIKEYHLARIDNRPMKVDFAIKPAQPQSAQNVVNQNNRPANNQAQKQQNGMPAKRRNNNRIGKSGQGKTLNVRGANQRRRQRGGRVNQQ